MDHEWTAGGNPDIVCLERLRASGYGELFRMRDNSSYPDNIFVRKITHDFYPISKKDIENETKAIDQLCKKGHARIIAVSGHSWMPAPYSRFCAIDMDYCESSLHEYIYGTGMWEIPERPPLAERIANILGIMMQISEGLAFIHENGYIHRNLVPRNILFKESSKSWVITEFSISSEITMGRSQIIADSRGTPGYCAPELLNPGVHDEKVDIWALGCMLYELVTQFPTFASDSAVYHYSQHPESLKEIPFGSELVGLMLQIDPDKRPSAGEIHDKLDESYKNTGVLINWALETIVRRINERDLSTSDLSSLEAIFLSGTRIRPSLRIPDERFMFRGMLEYASLSQLSWSQYRAMITLARNYVEDLRRFERQRAEPATVHLHTLRNSIPTLFTSLVRLYPELPILRIALASAYLDNADFAGALVTLKELEGIPDLSQDHRTAVRRVLEDFKSHIIDHRGRIERLQEHFLQFPWNLPNIFASEKELATEFPNFVALTAMKVDHGVAKQVMDVSVRVDRIRDFVAEQWGVIGSTVLDALQSILIKILNLKGPESVKEERIQLPVGACTIVATTTTLEILALCFDESWNHLVSCLVWISDVLGQPPESGLVVRGQLQLDHSSIDIDSTTFSLRTRLEFLSRKLSDYFPFGPRVWPRRSFERKDIKYNIIVTTITRLEKDQDIKNVSLTLFRERSCWRHLFDRAYIGCCTVHMIPEVNLEHWQCGLRMTFELMTSLAGIQKVVVHEDGIVLVGAGVALVPKRILDPRTRSVQWHLLERDTMESPPISLFDHDRFWKDALKTDAMKSRIMETDLDNLRGVAFMGWNPDDVCISWDPPSLTGSQPTHLSRAEAYEVPGGSAKQYNFQAGQPFFSFGVQRVKNRGLVCAAVRNSSPKQFASKLESLYNGTVVIFDVSPDREVGWLCSTIDLMVLLMRFHLRREGYSDPIVQRSRWANLVERPIDELRSLNMHDLRIPQDDRSTYGDLLERFCDQYVHLFGFLRQHQRRGYDTILGWDIFDLLYPTISGTVAPKTLPAEQGIQSWSSLIGTEDVIFVNGISKLIWATKSANCQIIDDHRKIPRGVLFCPLYLLKRLLQKYSCLIGTAHAENKDYEWIYRGTPYQCPDKHGTKECWKTRLQEARAKNLLYHVTGGYPPSENRTRFDPNSEHGAICFGRI